MFRTEYEFELPKGYVDQSGTLHKKGSMRLATAADEILPLKDPRVMQNAAYLTVILLTRVIVKLGSLQAIDTSVVENLFAADMSFLQDMYQRINQLDPNDYKVQCPKCGEAFTLPPDFFGQGQ
jgi:hypothetical protein